VLVDAGVEFEDVEIDGERAFVYYVDPSALRRKLGAQSQR